MPSGSSPRPTHFVCLPLVNKESKEQLTHSLSHFKDDFTNLLERDDHDTPESVTIDNLLRPLGSLHLTLGIMNLDTPKDIEKAVSFLQSLDMQSISHVPKDSQIGSEVDVGPGEQIWTKPFGTPLSFKLKGLATFGKPTNASVLYASPEDGHGHLQSFCASLSKAFQEAGMVKGEGRPLTLHATVVNTPFIRIKGRKKRLQYDVSTLLHEYRDFEWAGITAQSIDICQMGAKPVLDNDGRQTGDIAYRVVGSRSLK